MKKKFLIPLATLGGKLLFVSVFVFLIKNKNKNKTVGVKQIMTPERRSCAEQDQNPGPLIAQLHEPLVGLEPGAWTGGLKPNALQSLVALGEEVTSGRYLKAGSISIRNWEQSCSTSVSLSWMILSFQTEVFAGQWIAGLCNERHLYAVN